MKIGIDISQLAYENTGVANYLRSLVSELIKRDKTNSYVLFYSSLRKSPGSSVLDLGKTKNQEPRTNVQFKSFRIPPTILDLLWNRLHILPIENFIGPVDVFITSDWTEPPVKHAKKATILYDLLVYKYPQEMHNKTEFNPFKLLISPNIVAGQKRKLKWVRKEVDKIFCISKSTALDASQILNIPKEKLSVIYPGAS